MLLHRLCCGSKFCSMLAAVCWKSSGNCKDFKFWCGEEQERSWRMDIEQIFQMYLWYYRGKFGGCWQLPTHKNVSGSKLCRHNRGILAKCADIWQSGQHVADMLATFSAKCIIGHVGSNPIQSMVVKSWRENNKVPNRIQFDGIHLMLTYLLVSAGEAFSIYIILAHWCKSYTITIGWVFYRWSLILEYPQDKQKTAEIRHLGHFIIQVFTPVFVIPICITFKLELLSTCHYLRCYVHLVEIHPV